MTKLDKNISRETTRPAEAGRPLIVTLEPGDIISFRLKGTRQVVKTTLMACYHMALKAEARS